MNISDILNPTASINNSNTSTSTIYEEEHRLLSPPLSPFHNENVYYYQQQQHYHHHHQDYYDEHNNVTSTANNYGKPRSRFSEYEDAVICEGVAKGLTWGQISGQLPHRKRATCFNRYRTLQGIRKSRKRPSAAKYKPLTPPSSRRASIVSCSTRTFFTPSPSPPLASSPWLPTTPPLNNQYHNDSRYFGDYELVRTPSFTFGSLSSHRPTPTMWMESRPSCSYYH